MRRETIAAFQALQMHNVSLFYVDAAEARITGAGSSSISPRFANSCTEIRELMKAEHHVYQKNEHLNELWKAMGDPSGVLYFYGFQKQNGKEIPIAVAKYFELLAQSLPRLSAQAQKDLDEICGSMNTSISRTLRDKLFPSRTQ